MGLKIALDFRTPCILGWVHLRVRHCIERALSFPSASAALSLLLPSLLFRLLGSNRTFFKGAWDLEIFDLASLHTQWKNSFCLQSMKGAQWTGSCVVCWNCKCCHLWLLSWAVRKFYSELLPFKPEMNVLDDLSPLIPVLSGLNRGGIDLSDRFRLCLSENEWTANMSAGEREASQRLDWDS